SARPHWSLKCVRVSRVKVLQMAELFGLSIRKLQLPNTWSRTDGLACVPPSVDRPVRSLSLPMRAHPCVSARRVPKIVPLPQSNRAYARHRQRSVRCGYRVRHRGQTRRTNAPVQEPPREGLTEAG